ncbi:MAG: peptide ABC transporter substrate-binding protein [bacterium]|nr:peptide ABC transporter substrate-binding protein [Candidatus Wildermuthbacteria bacterium]MDP2664896.1 peptide ABC transporter substrate-binding protein [bacterium]
MNSISKNKFPSFSQWRKLPKFLSFREKVSLFLLFCVFFGSAIFLYVQNTKVVPDKGGTLVEGVLGSPRFLNPVYADANDVDRDLVQLLFAGLMRYDEQGNIIPDLAKKLRIEEGGKVYELTLKDKLQWSNGTPFTVDDVLFTVRTLQDPRYKSPVRANWIGVEVEKVSETTVRFRLQEPFAAFPERLTLKIIPAHIWQEISPENFALSIYNLKPVGMGPYKLKEAIRDDRSGSIKEVQLSINPRFQGEKPFIQTVVFKFFESEKSMRDAFERGDITSFAAVLKTQKQSLFSRTELHEFHIPRYFAIFFNLGITTDSAVRNKDMRRIFQDTLDKQKLVEALFGEFGNTVNSPVLPAIFGLSEPEETTLSKEAIASLAKANGYEKKDGRFLKIQSTGGLQKDLQIGNKGEEVTKLQQCLAKDKEVYPDGTVSGTFGPSTRQAVIKFQEKYADEVLTPIGLTAGTGKAGQGTRDVLNRLCFPESLVSTPLKITLHTLNEYPLKETAELLKQQWEEAGISVELKIQTSSDLERDTIKPRNYEALLFGEILGMIPDPFPFWHSSQKRDPGLNLTGYENKETDKLLEQARKEIDEQKRKELLEKAQTSLLKDIPALFLYDASYIYVTSPRIKGIVSGLIADPSQRFAGMGKWYIKTARAFK